MVKLADFGLSRRVQVKQQAISLRKSVSGLRPIGSVPVPVKSKLMAGPSMQSRQAR